MKPCKGPCPVDKVPTIWEAVPSFQKSPSKGIERTYHPHHMGWKGYEMTPFHTTWSLYVMLKFDAEDFF